LRHFIDGAATPPNLGGELKHTFRVHDRLHKRVQKSIECRYSRNRNA